LMRTALGIMLSVEGMTVLAEFSDGRDVLPTASIRTPDLILLSVNHSSLTDLDYISVWRQEFSQALIAVLVTGEHRGQDQAVLDHGAHLVLTKSISRSELLSVIKTALQKKMIL